MNHINQDNLSNLKKIYLTSVLNPINRFDINLKSINGFSIEEESSMVWNLVVAKIVCEFIEIRKGTREKILYSRIYYFYDGRPLPAPRIVSCKVSNYLTRYKSLTNQVIKASILISESGPMLFTAENRNLPDFVHIVKEDQPIAYITGPIDLSVELILERDKSYISNNHTFRYEKGT